MMTTERAPVFTHTLEAGTVDGETLTLTIELRPTTGRVWDPAHADAGANGTGTREVDGLELSICGETFDPRTGRDIGGGQVVGTLRVLLDRGQIRPELGAERAGRLLKVWERWHLNGMQATCSHQQARGETYTTHPSAACPDCGYKLGTAWLYEPIPADVEAFLRGLADVPRSGGAEARGEGFARALGLTMTASRVDRNPSMPDFEGDHYRCVLKKGRRRMTVYYSKGYGHNGAEPTLREVLDTLTSDVASVDNASSFEDWARDLGMEPDSRKAERMYCAIGDQGEKLRRLLGDDYGRALEVAR